MSSAASLNVRNYKTEEQETAQIFHICLKFPKVVEGVMRKKKELCCDMMYLAVVSVECLQLLDIIHVDALRQRLGAQVRRGKWRQGVGCICISKNVDRCHSFHSHRHTHKGSRILGTETV